MNKFKISFFRFLKQATYFNFTEVEYD